MGKLGKTDNIFVVYPSFAGGNHLANLIGLCENVEPTWLNGKKLLQKYKKRNSNDAGINTGGMIAHYNMPNNTEANEERLFNWADQFIKQTADGYINLLQGHHHSYGKIGHSFVHWNDKIFDGITNIKWLMIEYPSDINSLCSQRMHIEKRNIEPLEDEKKLYKKLDKPRNWDYSHFSNHPNKLTTLDKIYTMNPDTNAVSISSDVFFSYEGVNLVRDMLRDYFNLELPEIADDIHNTWIDMIKKRIDYYNKHET